MLWAILGGIFGLILLLLLLPVSLRFQYRQEELRLRLHYAFLRFDLSPERLLALAEKKPDAALADEAKEAQRTQKARKGEKPTDTKKPTMLAVTLDLLRSSRGPWNLLRRHIVFYKIHLYLLICGEDAHATAMRHGGLSAVVFNGLAWLGRLFVVKNPTVYIAPDFAGTKSRYDLAFRLRLRPIFAVAAAVHLLWRFLRLQVSRKAERPVRRRQPAEKV